MHTLYCLFRFYKQNANSNLFCFNELINFDISTSNLIPKRNSLYKNLQVTNPRTHSNSTWQKACLYNQPLRQTSYKFNSYFHSDCYINSKIEQNDAFFNNSRAKVILTFNRSLIPTLQTPFMQLKNSNCGYLN